MSAQHTPGPWVEDEACICGFDGAPVAQTCRRDEFWELSDDDLPADERDRIAANAHLIAAAPELLALLIRYRNETPLGHQPHMIAHLADAAIAKAGGAS